MNDKGLTPIKRDVSEGSRFILSFIQALLKTGYYTPGHPETQKARSGLYDGFQSLLKDYREITFVAVSTEGKRDVLVDGIVDEPVTLSSLMLKGMAEIFIPKFIEYFDRKNLSSFSVKSDITRNEFEAFIDIMSESTLQEEREIDIREGLTLELLKRQILKVSTIFNVDLVGKNRKLPWRVEIALTRLKRDLSLIPLYKNLSKEKIVEIKNAVFNDIVRPMKNPELIKDMIINSDLISLDIPGMRKEEFEDSITDFLHRDSLLLAAPGVLKNFILIKESYEKLRDDSILPRLTFLKNIAKRVVLKIIQHGLFKEEVIMDYFKHGIVTIEELPEELRMRAKRKKEFEKFLKEPQGYFITLQETKDKEELMESALVLLSFLPELLLRDLYIEAKEVLEKVKKARINLSEVDSPLVAEIITAIEKKLEVRIKEEQIKIIMEMIDMMDEVSTKVLMDLITHEKRLVRESACEILIKHGKVVIPILKRAIEKRRDWQFLRNALIVLGEVGHGVEGLGEIFKKFLQYEEPRVREEAVSGTVKVMGADAETWLLDSLEDKDPGVRRRSVWALGKINCLKPATIDYFVDVIKGKRGEDEATMGQVLSSIESYPVDLNETKQLEEAILEVLSREFSILSKLKSGSVLSNKLKAKACEALGYIGDKRSIRLLKKMAKVKDHSIRTKAIESIGRIQRRIA